MAITQSYFTGMDMDASYSLRDQKKYYKLRNGSLTIDEELGTGTVSNINGNLYSFELPANIDDPSDKGLSSSGIQVILGAGIIDEYIILFSANQNGGSIPTSSIRSNGSQPPYIERDIGIIWAFKYDEVTQEVVDIDKISVPGKLLLDPDIHVVFYDRLNFKTNRPIKVIGNSESPDIKKAYFVDDYNPVRYINVVEEDIKNQPIAYLELVEDVVFNEPSAYVISGGQFMPGVVQYSFQMFAYGGGETKFSPAGPLINISASSYTLSSSRDFVGTEFTPPFIAEGDDTGTDEGDDTNLTAGEPTYKACRVDIKNFDRRFSDLRLVRIFYDTEYATPQIDIIAEFSIEASGTLSFVDDGVITLGSITQQEYAALGGVVFSAKDLATSNNRLIAANISELYFYPDYDARAYSFNNSNEAKVQEDLNQTTYYDIDSNGDWDYYENNVASGSGSGWDIPYEFDSVNTNTETYRFTADGANLGGTGKHISYSFGIEELLIDDNQLTREDEGEYNDNSLRLVEERTHEVKLMAGYDSQEWERIFGTGFVNNKGYANYASEINSSNVVGYQRDEIYRFGIVFFDSKGRQSFVYWIGDIRMPSISDNVGGIDFNMTRVETDGGEIITNTYAKVLYPKFIINGYPEDAVSYQIVRVARESSDKTIVAAGIATPCARGLEGPNDEALIYQPAGSMLRQHLVGYKRNDDEGNDPGSNFYYTLGSRSWSSMFGATYAWNWDNPQDDGTVGSSYIITYSDTLINFWSPEISFNKTLPLSNAKLNVIGEIEKNYSAEFVEKASDGSAAHPEDLFYKGKHISPFASKKIIDLDYKVLITKQTESKRFSYDNSAYKYKHSYSHAFNITDVAWKQGKRSFRSQAGAGMIGNATSSISTILGSDGKDYNILYAYLKREDITQYNGRSFEDRKSNKYIKASTIYNVTKTEAFVFGGDTYITMFEQLRHYNFEDERSMSWNWTNPSSAKPHGAKGFLNVVVYPVETAVNVDWRTDQSYTRSEGHRENIRETKGTNEAAGAHFDQPSDMYKSNYAYIRLNDILLFQEEPKFFEKLVTDLSHRLMASDAKFDGESSDNWLKFKPNNILDVDGTNGEINAVSSISSYLYFFQRKGIGVTQIDERALVNDSEGISLVLGTGDIFGKPQYLSQEEGVISPFSIVKGRSGVYFYDDVSKIIGAVGGDGVTDISRIKGVRSYIKNNSTKAIIDPYDIDGVIAGFDATIGMVYFTFSNSSTPNLDSFTIGYDETIGQFVSLYDFIPRIYFGDYTRFITIDLGTKNRGWLHNVGLKGNFYEQDNATILTSFITAEPKITKVFDGIEYTHDTDESAVTGLPPTNDQTFSNIRVYNNFLDTGLNLINSKFRFRTWRAKLPRYIDPINGKDTRILGKYLKIDLVFDNSSNQPLFLQPMLTFWRPIAFIEP